MGNQQIEQRPKGWRARLSPQRHFQRYGRRVRCMVCKTWQRTDPAKHAAGWRLREMACDVGGCDGRLRSVEWWDRMEGGFSERGVVAGLDCHEAKRTEEPRASQHSRLIRLGVDMAALLDDTESGIAKRLRK